MASTDDFADIADYADYWEQLHASHAHHPANRYRYWLIARRIEQANVSFETVLDCGCGDGSLLALVRSKFAPIQTFGLDINPTNVELLQTRESRSEFSCADLGAPEPEMPWPPVDLALCCEVIEHVPDDDQAIRNLANLVRPGGTLVLTTQSGKIRRTEQFLGHLRHYDIDDLRGRVAEAGFEIIECFLSGWPLLDGQKILAERFFQQVQDKIIAPGKPSVAIRAAFSVLFHAYKLCAFGRGPQIFILARRVGETPESP